jgi:hypothetical protein
MIRTRALAVAFAAIAAGPTMLTAQMPGMGSTRPIALVISGGLTLPSGDLGNFHDSGFHYDASLIFNIPGFPIGLRPEFSLTQFKLKDVVSAPPGTDDVTNMMAFLGNLEIGLGGGLYVLAGGGILSMSVPEALAPDGEEESSKKFTFDAGAGLRFSLGAMKGFVEARIGTASYEQGKVGFAKAQFIPVSFGLVF